MFQGRVFHKLLDDDKMKVGELTSASADSSWFSPSGPYGLYHHLLYENLHDFDCTRKITIGEKKYSLTLRPVSDFGTSNSGVFLPARTGSFKVKPWHYSAA